MQAWEIVSGDGVDALKLNERETPVLGPRQVRVRMNANSINYRDLITIEGAGARKLPFPTVPNSDGAGVIARRAEWLPLRELHLP
jgi:NADPH:quinone reductase-like Zn-dependent oxidoreductase